MQKKTRLKIGIMILVMGMISFSDWSFAADGNETFDSVAWFLNVFVSLLQWLWIPFANMAGQLLTNNWVYGEIFGIDALLWQYRNVMKNIANFCLGFYFLYTILSALVKKDSIATKIKGILLWILVAGVGIQASWFLTAVTVDVSTITLSMAGALPSQLIAQDSDLENSIKNRVSVLMDEGRFNVKKGLLLELFPKDKKAGQNSKSEPFILSNDISFDQFLDNILVNQQSASGPLIYMGLFILKTNGINAADTSSVNGWKKTILNTFLQGGTTIVYAIEMFVLFVMALFRVVYLWMFIVLSPLAILIWCIGKSGTKMDDKNGLGGFFKLIQPKAFLINVFKPTIIVLGIGIAMMFTSLMSNLVERNIDRNVDIGGVKFASYKDETTNTNGADQTYTTTIESGFLKFTLAHAAKSFMDIVLSVLTVVLVYLIISLAVNMSSKGDDFVSKKVSGLQKKVTEGLTSVPIVPVAGYDKQGVPTTHHMSLKGLTSLSETGIDRVQSKVDSKISEQQASIIDSFFKDGGLTEANKNQIKTVRTNRQLKGLNILTKQKEIINDVNNGILTEGGSNMRLDGQIDSFWAGEFTNWLNDVDLNSLPQDGGNQKWRSLVNTWQSLEEKTLDNLFDNNSKNVKTYVDFFGLDENITTWKQLKVVDISKKK